MARDDVKTEQKDISKDGFAEANLASYKDAYEKIQTKTGTSEGEKKQEIVELKAAIYRANKDIVEITTSSDAKPNGVQSIVSSLNSHGQNLMINLLAPEVRAEIQNEFIRLSRNQFPKEHKQLADKVINRKQETAESYKESAIPVIKSLAIDTTYNQENLFPRTFPKAHIITGLDNISLRYENGQPYFVETIGEKETVVRYSASSGKMVKSSVQDSIEATKDRLADLMPYALANEKEKDENNNLSNPGIDSLSL